MAVGCITHPAGTGIKKVEDLIGKQKKGGSKMTNVTKIAPKKAGGAREERNDENIAIARGTCVRCGRKLTNPLSVSRGMGPGCYKKYASDFVKRESKKKKQKQLQIPPVAADLPKHEGKRKTIFAFSCKAGELQEKLRENRALFEALLKEYQIKIA